MDHKPTPEQERIFLFTKKRHENLLITARAGTGKTSTAIECAKLLPQDKSIMFLAFNKHIQEELKTKLPEYIRCYTTYGLGMSAIKRKYGDKIAFDDFKIDKIIQKKSKTWDLHEEFDDEEEILFYQNQLKKLVNLCRLTLTLKPEFIPYIAERYDVNLKKNVDIKRVLKVLDEATTDRKSFDYTDMIYLPAIDNSLWMFPQNYVFVDECLPYKTYISTIEGKQQIGTLYNLTKRNIELPKIITYNENKKIFENKKINKIWCTGEKEIYCVVLNGKRKLKSTINHRFLTNQGWKRLDELKINDIVLSNYHEQPYHQILNNTQENIVIESKLGPEDRNNFNDMVWVNKKNNNMGCMVVTKEHLYCGKEKTYDMEVEDNNNFIITSLSKIKTKAENYGIIAHNCQDFNRCQIKIVEKILKRDKLSGKITGRLFSFGDFFQGVYGFNAADDKAFEWFEKFPNTKALPLTTSFRCAKNIITKAQEIVPDIKALDDAPDGIVRDGDVLTEAQSGDFVLCRTTMPLVKLFFEFLTRNKKAIIKGSDIGVHLIELIGKITDIDKLIIFWNAELLKFRRDLKFDGVLNPQEHTGYSVLEDKVMTLLFLARLSDSIADLKNKIKTIFTDEIQEIVLSTVHKIKGLEANRVFIIRPDLLPMTTAKSWQWIQEKNLEYVAYTRAKLELIFDRTWTDDEK